MYSAPVNKAVGCQRAVYVFSFLGVVDLVTIAPFWVEQGLKYGGIHVDTFIFRVIRLFRVLPPPATHAMLTNSKAGETGCQTGLVPRQCKLRPQ